MIKTSSDPAEEPRLAHYERMRLLGEIDGLDLEGHEGGSISVFLHIKGRKIELIRTVFGGTISHHITREGIAGCISRSSV